MFAGFPDFVRIGKLMSTKSSCSLKFLKFFNHKVSIIPLLELVYFVFVNLFMVRTDSFLYLWNCQLTIDIVLLWKFMSSEPKSYTCSPSCKTFFKLKYWLWKYGTYDIAVSEDNLYIYRNYIKHIFDRFYISYATGGFDILKSTIIELYFHLTTKFKSLLPDVSLIHNLTKNQNI